MPAQVGTNEHPVIFGLIKSYVCGHSKGFHLEATCTWPQFWSLQSAWVLSFCMAKLTLFLLQHLWSVTCPWNTFFLSGNSWWEVCPLVRQRKGKFMDQSGMCLYFRVFYSIFNCSLGKSVVAYQDAVSSMLRICTSGCASLFSESSPQCSCCTKFQSTLHTMMRRLERAVNTPHPSERTYFRYLTSPQKIDRMKKLRADLRQSQKDVQGLSKAGKANTRRECQCRWGHAQRPMCYYGE